ncbi:hypothetical protein [Sandaracinus amylolyticus]|uniref:Uncharacterized protein n=1 Tax=Sandaracinus amylolyticus TaxID=927083 RepID=A0A0F6YM31_9BACT|nr:hypothetical protein [Sandaracinus amylolyticus]AKF10216.1 hypothetical protein DB32_007365 [Sandaracinus amylolyticus]
MRLNVTFGARALVGANDGLDAQACAARYAGLLRDALRRDHPDASIEVTWSDDRAPTHVDVQGVDEERRARAIERDALDVAWVVKQMEPWGA